MKKMLLTTLSFIGSLYSMQERSFWTPEEDQKLTDLVSLYNGFPKWVEIAEKMPGRKRAQCRQRWVESLDPNISHSIWIPEEDQKLTDLVSLYNGSPKWSEIAKQISRRTSKQCRERWNWVTNPNINHSTWTDEEDILLVQKYKELGPKWAKIKFFFNNRTTNQLKARYEAIINKTKRRFIEQNFPALRVRFQSQIENYFFETTFNDFYYD